MRFNHFKILKKQHGTAIIMALFVMSIVVVIAVAMISRLNVDIRRTQLLLNSNQAYLYAEGSIAWARDQLIENLKNKKQNQLIDNTPIVSKLDEMNGFTIQSTIYDAQGYFNINNLVSDDDQNNYSSNFVKLLRTLDPQVDLPTATSITLNIHNWLSARGSNFDSENYYSKLIPPYSAAHRLMASPSELRLVKGITPKLYEKLLTHIIALPEITTLNVNSASPLLLSCLSQTLTLEGAKGIDSYRKQAHFTDITKFLEFDILKNNPIPATKITVTSNYFLVITSVKVAQQDTILYTLLRRTTDSDKPTVTVLWQTKGTL